MTALKPLERLKGKKPSLPNWLKLWAALDKVDDEQQLQEALQDAEAILSDYPDELRQPPKPLSFEEIEPCAYWQAESQKPRWRLVRSFCPFGCSLQGEAIASLTPCLTNTKLIHLDLSDLKLCSESFSKFIQEAQPESLRHLNLSGCGLSDQTISELLASEKWSASLDVLDISGNAVNETAVANLVSCSHLKGLKTLRLAERKLNKAAGETLLATTDPWPSITSLDLSNAELGSRRIEILLKWSPLEQLKQLSLRDNGVKYKQITPLLQQLLNIEWLDLSVNSVGGQPASNLKAGKAAPGVAAFQEMPHLAQLRWLSLSSTYLWPADVAAIVQTPHLTQLEHLDLSRNNVCVEGMTALAESKIPRKLRFLSLAQSKIGQSCQQDKTIPVGPHHNAYTDAFRTLIAKLKNLEYLNLNTCRLYPKHAEILASHIPTLKALRIGGWDQYAFKNIYITHTDDLRGHLGPLLNSKRLRQLQWLDLRELILSDDDLDALATSAYLSKVRILDLSNCEIGVKRFSQMLTSPAFSKLEMLNIKGNNLGEAGATALIESKLSRSLRLIGIQEMDLDSRARLVEHFDTRPWRPVEFQRFFL